jgi:hypothetical protein
MNGHRVSGMKSVVDSLDWDHERIFKDGMV